MASSGLPEQVFALGERVMFMRIANETWLEGIVSGATLMSDGTIAFDCVADSGYSDKRLVVGHQVKALSAVDRLGKITP